MSEVKDPTIKLFGKTIDVVGEESLNQDPSCCCSSDSVLGDSHLDMDTEELESEKSLPGPKQDDAKKEDLASDELIDSNSTPPVVEESKTLSADSDAGPSQTSKTEEDQNETSNPNEKTLKKPDKILPCPRCNSMDTKFCYFNNYNVNQPRHFCKNCQRYWTAGGSMRNVPVGAGRRKTKTAASLFHHLAVPEALENQDLPNGVHHPNGTVLTFSSDAPFCESMVSVLNIADKNGFQKPGELAIPVCLKENGEDQSCGSTVGATSSKDESGKNMLLDQVPNCHQFPPQIPVFPGAPWPYPWNSVRWSSPLSPSNFGPPGFPLPFYSTPPPYWGCTVPGSWNIPWVLPQTASQSHTPPSSGPNSTTLGKHSRDDSILKPENEVEDTRKQSNPEKCLWHPKTLRIDDPEEAAKSSIWATLGIKNDRVDSVGKDGLFKAFQSQSKEDKMAHLPKPPTALQANPAALSRSLIFHESS